MDHLSVVIRQINHIKLNQEKKIGSNSQGLRAVSKTINPKSLILNDTLPPTGAVIYDIT